MFSVLCLSSCLAHHKPCCHYYHIAAHNYLHLAIVHKTSIIHPSMVDTNSMLPCSNTDKVNNKSCVMPWCTMNMVADYCRVTLFPLSRRQREMTVISRQNVALSHSRVFAIDEGPVSTQVKSRYMSWHHSTSINRSEERREILSDRWEWSCPSAYEIDHLNKFDKIAHLQIQPGSTWYLKYY